MIKKKKVIENSCKRSSSLPILLPRVRTGPGLAISHRLSPLFLKSLKNGALFHKPHTQSFSTSLPLMFNRFSEHLVYVSCSEVQSCYFLSRTSLFLSIFYNLCTGYYTLILSSLGCIDPDLSVLSTPLYFLNNFHSSSDYLQLHFSSNTRSMTVIQHKPHHCFGDWKRFKFIIQSMPTYTTWEKNMRCLSQQLTVAKYLCS